jgi:hypothetical protein
MLALPAATTVTVAVLPWPATVATDVLLLAQANVPPDGVPVAVNVPVLPVPHRLRGLGLRVTLQVHLTVPLLGGVEALGPLLLFELLQQEGQHMVDPPT